MKQYPMLQAIFLSFSSRDLYRDVRENWKGTGFLYLLVLLALTWVPVMVKVHLAISDGVRQEAPKYIEQVPRITIEKGEVSIDRPVPYTISEPESGTPLVLIDTSGRTTSFEQADVPVLLTKDKLMYQKPDSAETRICDLSSIEGLTIDQEDVHRWVEAFRKYFAAAAYPFALAGSFAYRIIQVLIYAAIGMVIARRFKASLDYLTVLRLTSVAVTPAIILHTLSTLAALRVPAAGLISFVVAMGYLYFAVKANAGRGEADGGTEVR